MSENKNVAVKKADEYPLVVSIDPSTGARSDLGFSIYDPNTMEILTVKELKHPHPDLRTRIKGLIVQLVKEFKKLDETGLDYVVFIESTVMRGKGGESLQRIIGAIMTIIPTGVRVEDVSNMQVKMYVAGHGHAKKDQVANGLIKFFPNEEIVKDMIRSHRYDALDSLAIGLTGFEKFIMKSKVLNVSRIKRKGKT